MLEGQTCSLGRAFTKWLSNPEVLQYYGGRDRPHDLKLVKEHFFDKVKDASRGITRCIVELGGNSIGFIQFYILDSASKKEYGYMDCDKIYGTDQFIGEPEYWNKGIGKMLVRTMLNYLKNEKGASKIVMDPQCWNKRAIACYEKCDLKKVKLLPKHEYHEGEMKDSWLLEFS